MPCSDSPREALVGSETRLPRVEPVRPWVAAENSSSGHMVSKETGSRWLLSISGHSTHCHPKGAG